MSEFRTAPMKDGIRYNSKGEPLTSSESQPRTPRHRHAWGYWDHDIKVSSKVGAFCIDCGKVRSPGRKSTLVSRASFEAEAAQDSRPLTFAEFAATNRSRCESVDGFGHPLSGWSLSDWFLAATGEFGEAANKAKKLNRIRDGIPGNTESEEELRAGLADEVADAVIYLDLLAQAAGFSLVTAVISKFNRPSEKIGSPARLAAEEPHD